MSDRALVFPNGPPKWPLQDEAVQQALHKAWADGSWGRYAGPHCEQLKTTLQEMFCASETTLCASGTIAVELALRSGAIETGDRVAIAAYDFPGNFRAIEAVGARPVLFDIHANTWCLDEEQLAEFLRKDTESPGPLKAIIVSHMHGGLANMPKIMPLAAQHGLHVVEDACQVPGAKIAGKPAGSWGHAGVLSFGGSKLLTAGRGGAVLTQDPTLHQRIRVFSERGNSAFPLSELQAAVLLPQLKQLAVRNKVRNKNANSLNQKTASIAALQPLQNDVAGETAYYKLPWKLVGDHVVNEQGDSVEKKKRMQPADRQAFLANLQEEGIAIGEGFRGFASRSARRCDKVGTLKNAQAAAAQTVLLHHPILLENDEAIQKVAAAFFKVFANNESNSC